MRWCPQGSSQALLEDGNMPFVQLDPWNQQDIGATGFEDELINPPRGHDEENRKKWHKSGTSLSGILRHRGSLRGKGRPNLNADTAGYFLWEDIKKQWLGPWKWNSDTSS